MFAVFNDHQLILELAAKSHDQTLPIEASAEIPRQTHIAILHSIVDEFYLSTNSAIFLFSSLISCYDFNEL